MGKVEEIARVLARAVPTSPRRRPGPSPDVGGNANHWVPVSACPELVEGPGRRSLGVRGLGWGVDQSAVLPSQIVKEFAVTSVWFRLVRLRLWANPWQLHQNKARPRAQWRVQAMCSRQDAKNAKETPDSRTLSSRRRSGPSCRRRRQRPDWAPASAGATEFSQLFTKIVNTELIWAKAPPLPLPRPLRRCPRRWPHRSPASAVSVHPAPRRYSPWRSAWQRSHRLRSGC